MTEIELQEMDEMMTVKLRLFGIEMDKDLDPVEGIEEMGIKISIRERLEMMEIEMIKMVIFVSVLTIYPFFKI